MELLATIGMLTFLSIWGFKSLEYAVIFTLGSLSVKIVGWLIVRQAEPNWIELQVAAFFALALGWLAYHGLHGVGDINPWIVLPEGVILCFLGAALGFRAPFADDRSVLVPLAAMWLSLGAFDFGLILHPASLTWAKLADMGSYLIVIAAFGWIGVSSRYGTSTATRAPNRT